MPKIEPVAPEDEGCTAAVEMPVAVVSGIWVFEGGGFVPNSPPDVEEDRDSAVPNEQVDEVDFKVSLFEETAFVPKRLLADGALELLILGLPSFIPKRPFTDGALDVVLLKGLDPDKPVKLGDVRLDASLFAVLLKNMFVEVAFEV